MMAKTIPTRTDLGRYQFSIALGETVFILAFAFNRRDSHWYLGLTNAAGESIRDPVRVTPNWPLFRQLVQQGRPDGLIMAIDPQGNLEPGLADLGAQVRLTFEDGS